MTRIPPLTVARQSGRILSLWVALAVSAASAAPLTGGHDVRACLPLSASRLLVGTAGGLVLADAALHATRGGRSSLGSPPERLTALSGLPGTRILAVAPVRDPLLSAPGAPPRFWVGTEGGLAQVSLRAGRLRVEQTWPSAPVRAVLSAPDGLYVATFGDGLLHLAVGARALETLGGAGQQLTSLARYRGRLYVGTAGDGLRVWRPGQARPGQARPGRLQPVAHFEPVRFVWALSASPAGLRIGTLVGLFRLADAAPVRLDTRDTRALAPGLVATYGQGVTGGPTGPRYVAAAQVSAAGACVGGPQGLWYRPKAGVWRSVALSGPPSADLSALAWDGQRLYVGTFDRGLTALDPSTGRWEAVSDPALDPRINALAASGPELYAATARGLSRRDAQGHWTRITTRQGLFSDDIHSLSALRTGGVLVGTSNGVAWVKRGRVTPLWRKQGLWVRAVWAIVERADGSLAIGTSRGLYLGHRGRRGRRRWHFKRYSVASGHLPDDWITALVEHDDTLYVGTYAHGVVALQGDTWRRLGGGWINLGGLRFGGGHLYASTMEGLLRLDRGRFAPLPKAAPGRDVTATVATATHLYVASRRGLGVMPLGSRAPRPPHE